MRLLLFAVAVLLLSASASWARQEAGRVVVRVAVEGKDDGPAPELRAEDLRVLTDGAEQKVVSLSRASDEPLHVVVMLDASVSQEDVLPVARRAAAEFVSALLRRGLDDAAVISFTNDAAVVQGLTGDLVALRRAAESVEVVRPPGYVGGGIVVTGAPPRGAMPGSTALWDSLVYVCEHVLAPSAGRRAVVVVTDGVDTSSRTKSDRAVERLLRDGVAVYGVGIAAPGSFDGVDKGALHKVSERTGGRALFPRKAKELPEAFGQIRRELLDSYALTFGAPAGLGAGKTLKLRVELANPELRKRDVRLSYPQALLK